MSQVRKINIHLIIFIIIESNILNPTYKELIAIEKYRNGDTGRIYSDRHTNNWIKAIISIFAIAMLLGMMGVPIYNGIYAMESNALPYDMEITTNTGHMVTSSGSVGDIIAYEIFHWGHLPSISQLESLIENALVAAGVGWLINILAPVIYTFSSIFLGSIEAYGLSLSSVEFGLDYAAAGVSIAIDPPTLVAIATVLVAA